jgi:hypothetical protein
MAFQEFERAILAEPLKRIAAHWLEVRGARAVPDWGDIRPSALGPHLSIIWSWKYDPDTDSFTGRLAGHVIESVFRKSFRGAPMREMFAASEYMHFYNRHKRVVIEPALFHGVGMVFGRLEHYGTGERIILPLSDGLLGATVYERVPGEIGQPAAATGEREQWFSLA